MTYLRTQTSKIRLTLIPCETHATHTHSYTRIATNKRREPLTSTSTFLSFGQTKHHTQNSGTQPVFLCHSTHFTRIRKEQHTQNTSCLRTRLLIVLPSPLLILPSRNLARSSSPPCSMLLLIRVLYFILLDRQRQPQQQHGNNNNNNNGSSGHDLEPSSLPVLFLSSTNSLLLLQFHYFCDSFSPLSGYFPSRLSIISLLLLLLLVLFVFISAVRHRDQVIFVPSSFMVSVSRLPGLCPSFSVLCFG